MSDFASAMLPKTGDVIDGKYVLERLLGKGGMGAVYAARHLKLGHSVAIKVMLADASNHEAASRFVNEGRAAANIQNEHVVRVSDVDEENGYAYMVLELLEGEDLAQVLDREGRLAPHVVVGYVLQALDGVRQAHAQGIVHRDLKPSNLFLARRSDGGVVVKVLDFGISKANTSSLLGKPDALTSTKAMLGSPLYMSPEQLRSSKSVDARADIWAVGIILFELMTGTLPFSGESLGELFSQILESDAPPLRSRAATAPPGLEAVVARCLQRRPEHRFQTVAELERELAPFATSQAHFGTVAMGPPMGYAPPNVLASAAGTGPQLPAPFHAGPQALTGPQGHVSGVMGAVAGVTGPSQVGSNPNLGAVTPPQPLQSTGSAWQSTGSSTQKSAKGVVLALGGFALLAVVGVGLFGYSSWKGKHAAHAAGSAELASASSAASAANASSAPPPPEPSALASASPTPPAASASSSASVASGTPPGVGAHRHPTAPVGAKVEPPVTKVDPPPAAKVDPPPVVKVDPKPASHPPASIQQTTR